MSLADQQWLTARAKVSVLQARGLRIKGKEGAHALLQVGAQKFSTVRGQQRADPVWDGQEAAFELAGFPENSATLRVQVLQRALVGPDKVLGHADIDLGELYTDRTRDKAQWFRLLGKPGKPEKDRGEIQLDIQFLKGSMSASMFDLSGSDKSRSKIGKLKDKLRGKKKEGLSDSASAIVPSITQILTDSEGEEGEEPASPEKKKKNKLKSLFTPKSSLHRNMSQSMSTLGSFPERDSAIASSTSSGLNADSPEGKKKFKFLTHKRTGSADSRSSQSSVLSKQGAPPQICINGSHVYREEPEDKGSTISLTSSGHGSMEELRREREEREEEERKRKESEAEEQRQKIEEKERMSLEKEKEEQRRMIEEERQRKEREAEEQKRKIEEERQRKEREAEEHKRKIEEERQRKEREAEEHKRKIEEERQRKEREAEEQKRKIEEERQRKEREAEEQRQKTEAEKERLRIERQKEEQRQKIEEQRQQMEREAEEQRKKIEEERQRKDREAEEQRKVEEQKERMRLKREKEEQERKRKEMDAEEQRQKVEKERMRLEREKEEQRQKSEEERQRKEREAEEQKRKNEAEKERMRLEMEKEEQERKERVAEEQRRKTEEEEKAKQIAEEKRKRMEEEEKIRKEEEKKRKEAGRLAEEKKAREEEERRRKRVAEEEEAEKQKRAEERQAREEEERKEKERLRLEGEQKNMGERKNKQQEVKEAEQEPRPVPKARTGKVSTASKPQEEALSEAVSSTNPFECSSAEEPPSTNPFEEPASPQAPASVLSARVSAVKPSASVSRNISQPSVVNTNPFLDDGEDSVDCSLENLSSNERSMERMAKKGRAPLPPQNKPEMPKLIAPSRGVLLEETKQYSTSTEVSKRPAPQPPGSLKKTTEEPDSEHQSTASHGQEWKTLEGSEGSQSRGQERRLVECPDGHQPHDQQRKPLEGTEGPQSSRVAPISKDELKAWCIQSMKLGKEQNSSPQKADPNHNQAATKQQTTYGGHYHISQNQPSKKPADINPFICSEAVPAPIRHNKGPAPSKPLTTSTYSQKSSEDECSSNRDNSSNVKTAEGSVLVCKLSSKGTAAEPLQTICLDNLPKREKVGEPESLQLSTFPSVSKDVVCPESLASKFDGLPNMDSLAHESEALAETGVAKKKSQAPLPPAKPKRVGDTGLPNELPSVSASTSKVDLGRLPESQSIKKVQVHNQPKDTVSPTNPESSGASFLTFTPEKSEMKKVGVPMSADSGPGSRSLPLARVVPTDVQSSAGDLKGAGGTSASVIRPHAVKPLSSAADKQPDLRETSTSKAAGGNDNTLPKPEAEEEVAKGPYSQLTRAELVSLVVRQQDQLSQRDRRIGELEQYIDTLLVRVMEEQPSILMSLSSQKKAV